MAIKNRKGIFYTYFDPFKTGQIGLKLDVKTKSEAKQIEGMILRACRTGNYSGLDGAGREACIRMFGSKGWECPPELGGALRRPTEELTLWKAWSLFLKYPEIRTSKARERHEAAIIHLVQHFGREQLIKSIWVPDLKVYQSERLDEGAAPATVNWEMATLSRLFGVLIEMQAVDVNPVRLVKRLSVKASERQAYLSMGDVPLIAGKCPDWFQPMIWAAYYSGMRRGEILELTWSQVNMRDRMITLKPTDTKEGHWKRIPIRRELGAILEEVGRVRILGVDHVFLLNGKPVDKETFKNCWPRACEKLEKAELLKEPWPRFHDLRHTWKTNARRSGMDPEIREAILGHSERGKSVIERYGRISDQELLNAIDSMTFDHGETEIFVASGKKPPLKNSEHFLNNEGGKRKSGCRHATPTS